MKVDMMGHVKDITRQTMLSDGYCLSTVLHAERITADGRYQVTDSAGDTQGARWVRAHVPYCRQCFDANEHKAMSVKYLEGHHPNMVTAWHQGLLPMLILGEILDYVSRTEPALVRELMGFVGYNLAAPNVQATMCYDKFRYRFANLGNPLFAQANGATVIRVTSEMVLRSWQLLGSAAEYEKDRMVADWKAGNIRLPFTKTYFSFSEGLNYHLASQFFDNVPKHQLGPINVHGFLADADTKFMAEHISSSPIADRDQVNLYWSRMERRNYLWLVFARALMDEVFTVGQLQLPAPIARSPWVRSKGGSYTPVPSGPPTMFYTVKPNPKREFSDQVKRYGHRQINYSHRWSVVGHWRHYKDGRRVWISSYTKGPDDKPFVPSVRVYGGSWVSRGRAVVAGFWDRLIGRMKRLAGWA